MQQPPEILGKAVKDARTRLGLTQLILAENIGKSERTVIKIEGGESNLKLDALYPLIRVLKIDPREVFYPEMEREDPTIQRLRLMIEDCNAEEANVLISVIDSVLTALRSKEQSKL